MKSAAAEEGSTATSEVRAAGGVILREAARSHDVVVVHRPKYDDWSFPKGKLDPGESFEDAAVREVHEETGLACRLELPLSTITYRDAHGRAKEVRYFLMTVTGGDIGARPADLEVDQVLWVPAATAAELLTYERDRDLLAEALATRVGRGTRRD